MYGISSFEYYWLPRKKLPLLKVTGLDGTKVAFVLSFNNTGCASHFQ